MDRNEPLNISRSSAAAGESEPLGLSRAKELIQNAHFENAASFLQELLSGELDVDDEVEALYMLAVAQRYGKRTDATLITLATLLDKDRDYSRAYQEQGHVYLTLNKSADATQAFSKAVELNPGLLASWKALVALYKRTGQMQASQVAGQQAYFLSQLPPELLSVTSFIYENKTHKAERLCREFLLEHKHHVEAMRLLAEIGVRLNVYDDAEFLLESCVEFAPDYVRARIDYLNILIRKTKFEKAHEQAEILLREQPENPAFQSSFATTLVGLGRFEQGITVYQQVLASAPDQHEVQLLLGHAQKALGAFADAIRSYQAAYAIKSDFGDAFWSLANTKTYEFEDREITHIKIYEASPDVSLEDRIHLCFAAGKAFEDREAYDDAFQYYERGNSLKKQQIRYRAEETERRIQAQTEVCTVEFFEARKGVGFQCPDPIFIVGLPRSGSTLLEQILASHSMVDGTMELHNILALAQRLRGRSMEQAPKYPMILDELDFDYFKRFGEQFINDTQIYRGGSPFFIDKMPNNFLHIGLIRLILPNAKVIDARREPMACCFSGFKQLFGEGQEFTYGLDEIGRYYNGYVRLMDHWDKVIPGFVLRVMYENVVDDLEAQVRCILEFCDLPFEQRCLSFYETERSIRTPSAEQVRQPIYRSGLEQWRNFEAHLEPLVSALGPEVLMRYRNA